MILYKNVDLCDLQAIAENGILSMDRWEHGGLTACSKEFILQFAKTAPLMDSTHFNFFRGIEESGEIIDLYNIRYIF